MTARIAENSLCEDLPYLFTLLPAVMSQCGCCLLLNDVFMHSCCLGNIADAKSVFCGCEVQK